MNPLPLQEILFELELVPLIQKVILIKIKNKTKTLNDEEFYSIPEDICSICLETHVKNRTITSNCNHHFGSDCFHEWRKTCKKMKKNISCPYCNQNIYHITKYILKRKRCPQYKRKDNKKPILTKAGNLLISVFRFLFCC